jgi:hypothetical protein
MCDYSSRVFLSFLCLVENSHRSGRHTELSVAVGERGPVGQSSPRCWGKLGALGQALIGQYDRVDWGVSLLVLVVFPPVLQ